MSRERASHVSFSPYAPEAPKALTEADVRALEQRLGATLPEQYRAFLARQNGGEPTPSAFRFAHRSGPYTDGRVRYLFSVYDGKRSLEDRNALYKTRFSKRLPDEMVPIGADSFGNLVCLSVGAGEEGSVWFWNHDNEGQTASGAPWRENLSRIADSFDAFLAGLSDE